MLDLSIVFKSKNINVEDINNLILEQSKIYPNIVKVHFEKAKPIAKINSDENYIYLGDNGKIFKSSNVYDSIPEIQGKVNLEYLNKISYPTGMYFEDWKQ